MEKLKNAIMYTTSPMLIIGIIYWTCVAWIYAAKEVVTGGRNEQ